MKIKHTYYLPIFLIIVLLNNKSYSQFGIPTTTPSPVWGSIDTLSRITVDTAVISIDPDPTNNPFLSNGTVSSQDDPGGPGSGGGFGGPPPDAAIPVDGGVSFLLVGGALVAARRFKKKN